MSRRLPAPSPIPGRYRAQRNFKFTVSSNVGLFDSGTIIGTGGTGIQFASGTNTLTLGPGFNIQGNVLGAGNDTFQLGGSGTGAFNLSNIGTQYTGFTTFNVVSAMWVATGTGNQNWSISNGATLQLGDGIVADGGAITGNVVDNGTFAIDRADTYTFRGTISGAARSCRWDRAQLS